MTLNIFGVGTDIVKNSRIKKLIKNKKFINRIFTSREIKDSKKINHKERNHLYDEILKSCVAYSIISIEAKKIDEINILNATYLAMNLAIEKLKIKADKIIIDGNSFKAKKKIDFECIVGGDDKYISIAAASILSKVHRDNLMKKIDTEFPEYNWKQNKGYGTKENIEKIKKNGLSKYHRRSFKIKNKQLSLDV